MSRSRNGSPSGGPWRFDAPSDAARDRSLRANSHRLVALSALESVLFPIPIVTLFWKDQIGMSVTDIMVLQAVFGVAVVLLEFPSGYLADRVGYRISLLVGTVLWLGGWAVYAQGASFGAIVVAEILLGSGSAFISGADSALLWMTIRGLQGPILANVLQQDAPAEDRASVLSLARLLFRLAFVVVGPPIGALVDRAGIETALAALAVVFTAAAFVALGAFSRAHSEVRAASA